MTKFFIILILIINFPLNSADYILNNSGKRIIITEHNYSTKSFYRAFKLEGTFTDNYGNYGNFDAFVTTFINEGKILKLDFSNKYIFQNKKVIFMQGFREDGDEGAGVGKAIIVFADKAFEALLHNKCVYSIKFLDDTFFGLTKCDINEAALKNIK